MKKELEQRIGTPVLENEPLKNYTTFKIGGPAKYFVRIDNKEKLFQAVKAAYELNLPFFIIGGGSNMLIADQGFDGLVIKLAAGEMKINGNLVSAFAGNNLSKLIRDSLENKLGGLEFAGNVPGTVGGGVWGNAGAYGQGVGDFVKEVSVIIRTNNEIVIKKLSQPECAFKYRHSIFKENIDWIISEVVFELTPVENPEESLQKIKAERDAVLGQFKDLNIHARPGFPRMSKFPAFEERFPNPQADKAWKRGISLPAAANLNEEDVDFVCKAFVEITGKQKI